MQISDVNYAPLENMKGIRRRFIKQKFKISLGTAIFLVLVLCVIALFAIGNFAIYIFFVGYGIFEYQMSKLKSGIWRSFAEANNWPVLDPSQTKIGFIPNCLTNIGRGYKVSDAISVTLNNKNFVVYSMNFTTGSGKNRQTHFYTIARLGLPKKLPGILLDSKATYSLQGKKSQKISLEGDFNKYFSMYIDEGTQIDALSIITPDVMQTLVDLNRRYDVEIFQENVFFMIGSDRRNTEDVKSLFAAVDALADELQHKVKTYRPNTVK